MSGYMVAAELMAPVTEPMPKLTRVTGEHMQGLDSGLIAQCQSLACGWVGTPNDVPMNCSCPECGDDIEII